MSRLLYWNGSQDRPKFKTCNTKIIFGNGIDYRRI